MDYLPLFFTLKKRPCLLIGGGSIALRKARLLLRAGAELLVVAPEINPELKALVDANNGKCLNSEYQVQLLSDVVLVISATDDEDVNKKVAGDCKARNIPVNVVDNPELCTVIMPAIVDRSPLMIAVSSGGSAPVLTRVVRSKLETLIPGRFGNLAKFASRFRNKIKTAIRDGELRRRFWEDIIDGAIGESVLKGNEQQAELALENKLTSQKKNKQEINGEVYLVGAGPGDPDLLTFKALRLMQRAEVVLYDRLVSQPILDMVRRDAEFIYVGKRRAEHAVDQRDINQLLVDHALQGKRVLRLKGGDPFIFGRGGEEIDLLAQNHIPFQVVPGITAASGCAAYAGIPLTHRDYAQSVRFITGHLKEGALSLSDQDLVHDNQTLVFYMGLVALKEICEQLIAIGRAKDTPCALIEQGTTEKQRVHLSDLANIYTLVESRNVKAPTLFIIGGVVKLHEKLQWFKGQ